MAPAFRHLIATRPFRARDLPVDDDDDDKLKLVRELLGAGYLVRWTGG